MHNYKKILVSIIVFNLILISGCISNDSVLKGTGDGNRVIYLYKTACEGNTCPSYEIELLDNKVMYLTPIEMMAVETKQQRLLSQGEYEQLINAFVEADFFNFKAEYGDADTSPTMYVQFQYQGKSMKIKDSQGGPESLVELELMMQSFLDRVGWESVE